MNESILRQLLEGYDLPDEEVRCSSCFCRLHEGARVGVVARRVYDSEHWAANSVYCPEHTPERAPEVPHGESALTHAELGALVDTGRQTHRPALIEVAVVDVALDDTHEVPA